MVEILEELSEDAPKPLLFAGPWELLDDERGGVIKSPEWQRTIYRDSEPFGRARAFVMTADLRGHRGWIWEIVTTSTGYRAESPMRAIPLDSAKERVDKKLLEFGIRTMTAKQRVMF